MSNLIVFISYRALGALEIGQTESLPRQRKIGQMIGQNIWLAATFSFIVIRL